MRADRVFRMPDAHLRGSARITLNAERQFWLSAWLTMALVGATALTAVLGIMA
jgi:hypothetical protein